MADKPAAQKPQVGIEEYLKSKEKRAKSKLQLHIPLALKWVIAVPAAFVLLLILYFIFHLRFLPEH